MKPVFKEVTVDLMDGSKKAVNIRTKVNILERNRILDEHINTSGNVMNIKTFAIETDVLKLVIPESENPGVKIEDIESGSLDKIFGDFKEDFFGSLKKKV